MNETMAEALNAIEGQIELAKPKVPEGKTLVAIQLDRGDATTRYMVKTPPKWRAEGVAIAIRNGHTVHGNLIFGHISKGLPKITAAHRLICNHCGGTCIQPPAVWAAKDRAKAEANVDFPKKTPAMKILREWGKCTVCGAERSFEVAKEDEKADITAFGAKTLDALAATPVVERLTLPEFFHIVPLSEQCAPLPTDWEWLAPGMAEQGYKATPFNPDQVDRGWEVMCYNPGFWLGWVDDPHSTELFWIEDGEDRRGRTKGINLNTIKGL